MRTPTATILINGTVGVGKTTTAAALAALLRGLNVPYAVIDTDEIRRSWPAPDGDRFNTELQLANLRSLSANYRSAGARVLVVSGVIEAADMAERYRSAAGGHRMVLVRLTADLSVRSARIAFRHAGDAVGARWHQRRTVELDRILDDARLDNFTIDTSHQDPSSIAWDIWDHSVRLLDETGPDTSPIGPGRRPRSQGRASFSDPYGRARAYSGEA